MPAYGGGKRVLRHRSASGTPAAPAAMVLTDVAAAPVLWFKASDTTTVTKDGSDAVSAFANKGSATITLAQSTGVKQPIWTANAKGSKSALRFDGSNDRLIDTVSAFTVATTQAFSLYWYGKLDTALGNNYPWIFNFKGAGGSTPSCCFLFSVDASYADLGWGETGVNNWGSHKAALGGLGDGLYHSLLITYIGSSATSHASWKVYWDGTSKVISNGGGLPLAAVATGNSFGDRDDATILPLDGWVTEFAYWTHEFTAQQRTDLATYESQEYA